MDETRRRLLKIGAGAVATTSVAGCLESLGGGAPSVGTESGGDGGVTASFFTLADFTRNVAGDALEVENAVPMGQHGHGWEPPSDITIEIVEREAFVHLGIEGFQRWADEVAAQIAQNHAESVALIDVSEGIELSEYGAHDAHGEEGGHEGEGGNDHAQEDEHGHEEDSHDHGEYDPHIWVDPVRAKRAVENVRDRLVEMDGNNADTYEGNTAAYLADLDELHERFEEGLAGRERDAVVVAGHDSYGYLAERYGFEIHTPRGVSPDSEASPTEIAETVEFVENERIEVILYDYFEGDTLARTIVEEAETGTSVAALSPAESITEEWRSEGLDYIGQMEGINLPSLREALEAET